MKLQINTNKTISKSNVSRRQQRCSLKAICMLKAFCHKIVKASGYVELYLDSPW